MMSEINDDNDDIDDIDDIDDEKQNKEFIKWLSQIPLYIPSFSPTNVFDINEEYKNNNNYILGNEKLINCLNDVFNYNEYFLNLNEIGGKNNCAALTEQMLLMFLNDGYKPIKCIDNNNLPNLFINDINNNQSLYMLCDNNGNIPAFQTKEKGI